MKPDIRAAISAYPEPVQAALRDLRDLVLDTASQTPGVGTVEEALRWGQPSFLTTESGSGSTVRIDGFRNDPSKIAIFFHCRAGLVEQFRALYGDTLNFVGDRAIELRVGAPFAEGGAQALRSARANAPFAQEGSKEAQQSIMPTFMNNNV